MAGAITGCEKDSERDPRVHFIDFPKDECDDVDSRKQPLDLSRFQAELNQLRNAHGDKIGCVVTEPYLGGGAGLTGYRLDDFRQEFPEPEDPDGGLRRGPSGEVPYTRLPAGRGRALTAMRAAGVAIPVTDRVRLDVGYRYTDAGAVRTDPGDLLVVRYLADGGRRALVIPINETTADFRMHTLLATLRVGL